MARKVLQLHTDVLDALAEHHLVEDFSSSHAYEGMVHLRRAVRLQRLDVAVVLAVEGRRRSRAVLCLSGRRCGALCPPNIFLDNF